MRVNPQAIINSPFGVGLALVLGKSVPPRIGHRLARFLADWVSSRREWAMVQSLRVNQWVVSGCALGPGQLDLAVRDTYRHTARCLYDLYHYLENSSAIESLVKFSPRMDRLIELTRRGGEGVVIVSVHLSNFDFAMQISSRRGLCAQVLSAQQPGGGYRLQNALRKEAGLEITPTSVTAIRQAERRLQAGGAVLTGIDRPIAGSKYRPRFFGHPAALPVLHVTLALRTNTPIVVVATLMEKDGIYRVLASDPIPMRPYADRRTEITRNAEAVLSVAECFIRQAPQQWSMFYRVWPDIEISLS